MTSHSARSFRLSVLAAQAMTLAAAAQSTWVVDDDGPADFAQLQQAVLAAADGDTIVLRAGTYSGVTLNAKGLTVQGEGDPEVQGGHFFQPSTGLTVSNLAASQRLVVRGVRFRQGGLQDDIRLIDLVSNDGPILFEDCVFDGTTGNGYTFDAEACASLTLARCVSTSGATFATIHTGSLAGPVPYAGAAFRDCRVFAYDSEFFGGLGYPASTDIGGTLYGPFDAGRGVVLLGSDLIAVGCRIEGGDGIAPSGSVCAQGGDGAAGLDLADSAGVPSMARLIDCTILGGSGAVGACGQPAGSDAPAVVDASGGAAFFPGSARTGSVQSPVLSGTPATLTFDGLGGDLVFLVASPILGGAVPILSGPIALHVGVPFLLLPLGTVPASGSLTVPLSAPSLPPGVESAHWFLQSAGLAGGMTFDAGPSILTVLDPAL